MHFPSQPPNVGRHVRARGRVWRVDRTEPGAQGTWVTLRAADGAGPLDSCALIWPHDPLPPAAEPRVRRVPRRRAVRRVLAALAAERRHDQLWCAVDAAFDVHPWQLAPVAAVLHGTTRVLLADDVGLGKTVEAALIVAELRARGLMRRALVLAPVALAPAWLETLRTRFHLDTGLVTALDLQRWQHRPAAAGNPWQQAAVTVASIDLAKQPTAWASLTAVGVDVLVVDEAHHVAPATARGALVAHLAARTPWVVLCSATPHTGDAAHFDALCRLGETGHPHETPLRVFRRTRRILGVSTPGRTLKVLPVHISGAEWHLYARLDAYLQALRRGPARGEPGLQLLCTVLTRRLASSPGALRDTLQRRLASLDAAAPDHRDPYPSLFAALAGEDDDEDAEPWAGRAGLDSAADERQHLVSLCALADLPDGGAKHRALQRLLRRTREPLVVFSEYRATVVATARALPSGVRAGVLHGGLAPELRAHVIDTFLRGATRMLLTTDVAGEGLNLQHRARLVVTLDWPWRPHRLEQRIGRVDRLGQQRRVHALVLSARVPAEEAMQRALLQHRERADTALHARTTTPETACSGGALAARVHQQRRWRALGQDGDPRRALAGVWVLPPRRHTHALTVAAVVRQVSPDGQVQQQQVVAVQVLLRPEVLVRAPWARIVRRVAADPRVIEACRGAARAHTALGGAGEATERIAQIRAALTRRASAAVQTSLFDRRAEVRAEADRDARACVDAHLAGTARILRASATSGVTTGGHEAVTVVAVFPSQRRRSR